MANDETAYGEAVDGRVRVELDADGRLSDLYLDPRVAYLPLEELRDALFDAFDMAHYALRDRTAEAASRYATGVAPDRLKAVLAEASDTAERRFAEVSTVLCDLSRRAGRR
jgi:DNA-binding protein YbaB